MLEREGKKKDIVRSHGINLSSWNVEWNFFMAFTSTTIPLGALTLAP